MTAEKLDNGITRYTVGIFYEIQSARNARSQVRSLGYNDAFIVAFRNGKRIPINQALSLLGAEPLAEAKSVAANATDGNIQNDGVNNTTSLNVDAVSPVDVDGDEKTDLRIGYYNAPNSAPATEVEGTVKLFYTVQVGASTFGRLVTIRTR